MKELMKEKEGQIGGIIGDLHAKLERKEKEIEDLQGLLSRSFKSINSSADNFRMASKLDHGRPWWVVSGTTIGVRSSPASSRHMPRKPGWSRASSSLSSHRMAGTSSRSAT